MPNVGLFVGFNLPVYQKKLAAGVCEARARASADAALYEAERDQSHRDIKDLFVQAQVQQNILGLLTRTNLPAARQVLETTASDYRAGNAGVDYLSILSAWRDLLQLELQVAQIESELGKTLAALERAVGCSSTSIRLIPRRWRRRSRLGAVSCRCSRAREAPTPVR